LLEGRPFYTLHGHQQSATAVNFNRSGDFFATGGQDDKVLVWKTNFDNPEHMEQFRIEKMTSGPSAPPCMSHNSSRCQAPVCYANNSILKNSNKKTLQEVAHEDELEADEDDSISTIEDLKASTSTKISEARRKLATKVKNKNPKMGVVTVETTQPPPLPTQPPEKIPDVTGTLTPEPEPSRAESPQVNQKTPEKGNPPNKTDQILEQILGQLDLLNRAMCSLGERMDRVEDKVEEISKEKEKNKNNVENIQKEEAVEIQEENQVEEEIQYEIQEDQDESESPENKEE